MRLFFGIGFEEKTKERLVEVQDAVIENARKGNFTRRENLHLTLVFLGKTDRAVVPDLQNILQEFQFRPFDLVLNNLGVFEKRGGAVVWIGVQSNRSLFLLHRSLTRSLEKAGIQIEQLDFIPHVTLGRRVRWKDPESWMEKAGFEGTISARADKITLYHSHQIEGLLTYEPIFSVDSQT